MPLNCSAPAIDWAGLPPVLRQASSLLMAIPLKTSAGLGVFPTFSLRENGSSVRHRSSSGREGNTNATRHEIQNALEKHNSRGSMRRLFWKTLETTVGCG